MVTGAASQRAELVKGLAVAGLILVAMVGLFFYERGQFGEHEVAWEEAEAWSASESGSLTEAQGTDFTFDVTDVNVVRVRATVAWADDVGAADTFEVGLAGPKGFTGSLSGSASPLDLAVPVTELPEPVTVAARSGDDALTQAAADHENATAMGNWTVTVRLAAAPGADGPGGLGPGATADGANSFDLAFAVDVYRPVLATA